jgi:ribokinase
MVVVFGSINVDLVAQVSRIPTPGETLAGDSFRSLPGGKGANQALAASRAGADVRMFGAVGRDAFAATGLANLAASSIALEGIVTVDTPTGVALIQVAASGDNTITIVAGANGHARAAQVSDDLLGPDTTLLLQLEVPIGEVIRLVKRARGARIILNAAPAMTLSLELLRRVGTLIVNESEASLVGAEHGLPTTPELFASAASVRFGCTVVVTLGARGAIAIANREHIVVAAPPIESVDTTGAGDAFAGAFAAALDRGAPLRHAVAEGVAAGSLACTGLGAQAALPSRSAIAALAATL